jgi:hypothetical protein
MTEAAKQEVGPWSLTQRQLQAEMTEERRGEAEEQVLVSTQIYRWLQDLHL